MEEEAEYEEDEKEIEVSGGNLYILEGMV